MILVGSLCMHPDVAHAKLKAGLLLYHIETSGAKPRCARWHLGPSLSTPV
jgi:hypothetical protein